MPAVAELKNTFSWSFSAAADFEECRRKRYWGKYGMWGGWQKNAGEIQRAAWRLTKMESRHTLMGHAVEQSVIWVLREKQAGRDVSAEEAYEKIARPFLNRCWKDSRDGAWRDNPKQVCCLHEHYYKQHAPGKEWTAAVIEQTRACIGHFIERVLPRLAHVKPEQEIKVGKAGSGDGPENFELDGITVYAIPDYVYRMNEQWHIHDWKAGKPKPEHRDQVGLYGLWAHTRHGVAAENIFVYLEYLRDGTMAYEQMSDGILDNVRTAIRSSAEDMSEYLVDGDRSRNEPMPREEWELALTRTPCRSCNFYELCEPEFEPEEAGKATTDEPSSAEASEGKHE